MDAPLTQRLRRALSLPPYVVATTLTAKATREVRFRWMRRRDAARPTYALWEPDSGPPARLVAPPAPDVLLAHAEILAEIVPHVLDHEFDLLGSGPVRVHHGKLCAGLEGIRFVPAPEVAADADGSWLAGRVSDANLAEAQRVWRLVSPRYEPIDWQLDFKSGFRWSERTWYADVRYGHVRGADVKVPWELARMQHLPQLAHAYGLAAYGASGFAEPQVYLRELCDQVLDFVATNPPRFGVNWTSTMDVAIRVCNWLLARDLFLSWGAQFDDEFDAVFRRSVREHGTHIALNLEWSPNLRGNHYLSNIVGLLVVAGYLSATAETDLWLAVAVQELVRETGSQFGADGGNFEASTCYHRLSAEMVVFGTAFALALTDRVRRAGAGAIRGARIGPLRFEVGEPPGFGTGEEPLFPDWYVERVGRMAKFTRDVTKPDGEVVQIGDNDSGRFCKLTPRFRTEPGGDRPGDEPVPLIENHLDHSDLGCAVDALLNVLVQDRDSFSMDAELIRGLIVGGKGWKGLPAARQSTADVRIGEPLVFEEVSDQLGRLPPTQRSEAEIALPFDVADVELRLIAYPDFGLYLFRAEDWFMAVRCGSVGQHGNGGHAHNDQLGLLLSSATAEMKDPGSYLYTPLPERRNEYRSVRAHFAPRIEGREPARLDSGLFTMGGASPGQCLFFGREGFAGVHRGYGAPVFRMVELRGRQLRITDATECEEGRFVGCGELLEQSIGPPFSPGYGLREEA